MIIFESIRFVDIIACSFLRKLTESFQTMLWNDSLVEFSWTQAVEVSHISTLTASVLTRKFLEIFWFVAGRMKLKNWRIGKRQEGEEEKEEEDN